MHSQLWLTKHQPGHDCVSITSMSGQPENLLRLSNPLLNVILVPILIPTSQITMVKRPVPRSNHKMLDGLWMALLFAVDLTAAATLVASPHASFGGDNQRPLVLGIKSKHVRIYITRRTSVFCVGEGVHPTWVAANEWSSAASDVPILLYHTAKDPH